MLSSLPIAFSAPLALIALALLPVDQRAALVLVDGLGYGVAEAAEMLAVAPGTVKSRRARARARLAPVLREDEG